MSSGSESIANDTVAELHSGYIHYDCLEYVPIYERGAFSCSTTIEDDDDDDEDEDVKRILAEHGEIEPRRYGETIGFSSAYEEAAAAEKRSSAAAAAAVHETLTIDDDDDDDYDGDWDWALKTVSTVYPPLGVAAVTSRRSDVQRLQHCDDVTSETRVPDDKPCTGGELGKCLEATVVCEHESEDFVVAQPYRVAVKNVDFGKPKMSRDAVHESRKKVDNWLSKYVVDATSCRR